MAKPFSILQYLIERESETEAMVEVFILIAYSLSFQPDSTRPVEAFGLPPMIQSHGHKIAKCRRGRRTRASDDDFSVPDTQGYYSD